MFSKPLRALTILLIAAFVIPIFPAFGQSDLIAIDVLIQPDSRMVVEAEKWNALMREQYPEGFELDEEHAPHVTLIQQFITKSDLPKVLAAVDKVKANTDLSSLEMTATGFAHMSDGTNGLAGIVAEPNEQLHALQQEVIKALKDYAQKGGGESAFVPDKSGLPFDPALFEYVDNYVQSHAGENFHPHVTIGMAPLDWLEALERKPFDKFMFTAKGIAVYQLGNFGTAAKHLDGGRQDFDLLAIVR
jgi:2'-5' RNA ligase